ncbi:DNA-processing protein DprA [Nocardia arizonensis]|uniref:DNA-processing protein DprA n=1 Tax=Nocardia arizonensis TaxID=1141647 RepID=UPI0009E65F86|nr:DNA-processing protein DprA [Nocardia arizonensis]
MGHGRGGEQLAVDEVAPGVPRRDEAVAGWTENRPPRSTPGIGESGNAGAGFGVHEVIHGADDGTVGTVDLDAPPGGLDERRLAWVYLSRVTQGPCAALSALIEAVGVVEAARAVRECALPESLRAPTAQRRELDCAARDLEAAQRVGGRVVTPDDPDWPAWRMLGFTARSTDSEPDGGVPLVLWVRGARSVTESTDRAVAVVGARCSTGYGDRVTGDLASDLARRGISVVSGAAFGIDATAHRAALAVGGTTVAVLACGIDRAYPAQHERLLAEIAETGLVVSEYPPGTTARKHQFLARNRLIAGLADGVVVVEAGIRSGARNTVKWARRLGRPAFATPGPVTSAASVGCHRMIRDGEALLVTSADEVIDEIGPLRLSTPNTPGPNGSAGPTLCGDSATVYEAVPANGRRLPVQLSTRTGLPLHVVRAALTSLELAGLVDADRSGWYRTASQRRAP